MLTPTLNRRPVAEKLPPCGVVVLESHHAEDFQMGWRTHPFLKVLYLCSGEGRVDVGDQSFPWRRGDLVVAPPGVRNRIVDRGPGLVSVYILCISPKVLEFDAALIEATPSGRLRRTAEISRKAEGLLRRLRYSQAVGGRHASLEIVQRALAFCSLILGQSATGETPAEGDDERRVADYVRQLPNRFFEATSVDDAAAGLQLSRRRFTQLFRQATGESWLAAVHRLRAEHAQRLLRETDLPVTSVAFECGFGDLSTFYRVFGKQCGAAPAAWRRQQREV